MKRGKARKFCTVASTCGFVIGASFNSFVSFFNGNIKKSQRVVRFYFLGKLILTVHTVMIMKKYINRKGISKSSKTIINIATKELWLMVQGRVFNHFINYIIHHDCYFWIKVISFFQLYRVPKYIGSHYVKFLFSDLQPTR